MVRPSLALAISYVRWVVERENFTMVRYALAGVLLTAFLAGPVASGEKNAPKLTQEAKDGAQITQENIIKLKLKQAQPQMPPTPSLPLAPPSPPPSVN